jgi:hypothetical protein
MRKIYQTVLTLLERTEWNSLCIIVEWFSNKGYNDNSSAQKVNCYEDQWDQTGNMNDVNMDERLRRKYINKH